MLKTVLQLVAEAKAGIKEITIKQLEQQLTQQIVIIDVREFQEYTQGFIPGAINLSRGILESSLTDLPQVKGADCPLEELAKQELYLYCRSGARSALATESLIRMGFDKVCSVEGGFEAWKKANLRIEMP